MDGLLLPAVYDSRTKRCLPELRSGDRVRVVARAFPGATRVRVASAKSAGYLF